MSDIQAFTNQVHWWSLSPAAKSLPTLEFLNLESVATFPCRDTNSNASIGEADWFARAEGGEQP